MGIYFSKNPEDWAAVDGVYLAEIDPPARATISGGGGLSKFVGEFPWGPVDELLEFGAGSEQRLINTLLGETPDPENYKGWRSIDKKRWQRLRIVRLSNDTQAKAIRTLVDALAADVYSVEAKYPGIVGDQISTQHTDNTDGTFDLVISWGEISNTYAGLELTAASFETVDDPFVVLTLIDDVAPDMPATDADPVDLTGGSNGAFADEDYTGGPTDFRGLRVLELAEDGGEVFAAEYTSPAWISELMNHSNEKRCGAIAQADATDDFDANATAAEALGTQRLWLPLHRIKQIIAGVNTTVDLAPFIASALANEPRHISPASARNKKYFEQVTGWADGIIIGRGELQKAKEVGGLCLERDNDRRYKLNPGRASDAETFIATRRMRDLVATNTGLALMPFQNEPPSELNAQSGKKAISDRMALLIGPEGGTVNDQMIREFTVETVSRTSNMTIYEIRVGLWGENEAVVGKMIVGETVTFEEL